MGRRPAARPARSGYRGGMRTHDPSPKPAEAALPPRRVLGEEVWLVLGLSLAAAAAAPPRWWWPTSCWTPPPGSATWRCAARSGGCRADRALRRAAARASMASMAERRTFIPLADVTRLAATLYLPDGRAPAPAVLEALPYRK